MGRSPGITGLVASIITLLTMGVAVAQDATWKDCELAARDPDRSIAACSKLLKRPSGRAHAAAFHHRGQAFAAKGNLDQAISDISAGIRLDPQRAYRWQERGELYVRQGKYQQAIADITEAIKRDPTPRAFRFQSRAEAYQSLGDLTRAIADFDEAIRLDPEVRSFRFYARANALRDAGQYDRALADYETALKLTPTNVWALVDRGRTYARMGRSEAAKSDFDNALTLDPSNAELRHVIEVEVAALPGQSLPSTAQETPPQSPPLQQPAAAPASATGGASPVHQNTTAVAQGGSISSRPTFDCGKAKSTLALLICSGEEAARADWDLKIAYWVRYFSLDKDDRATFREDQDKWYTSLDQKCQLSAPPFSPQQTSCVIGAYKERAAQYRSKLTGDALAESKMTPEQLSQIQRALITMGFSSGEADGVFGPLTRAAIRKYQEANGFPQSDYLSTEQRRALLEGRTAPTAVGPSNARSATSGTASPPSPNDAAPAGQPADGEFARLLKIPAACQTARELGLSGRWDSQLFSDAGRRVPGPACLAAESCFMALKSQAAAGVEYLTRNPAVSDALSQLWTPRLSEAPAASMQRFLAAQRDYTNYSMPGRCLHVWSSINADWFPTEDRQRRTYKFLEFSTAGQTLLEKVRANYTADESEYQQLLTFNDRYPGLERLERARISYQQAFKNDDLTAMINGRPAMLQGLEQARARKQLLTQQSAQLVQHEHALADFVTAIDREGLTDFAGQQTQTAIGEVRSELARLGQMALGKRGDISARLEIFATRIGDIESAIRSARSMKAQAEQTRQMLVKSEGAANRVLNAASSKELKGAFDEGFRNSIKELTNRLRELGSSDLWVIYTKHEAVDAAMRKLEELQKGVSEAQTNYERLQTQRRMLVDGEGAARDVLVAASSEELKGGFDQAFVNSTDELINRFRDLQSSDLWLLPQRQEDIESARRKLGVLQHQISDAGARYDRAKKLDGVRQTSMQKIAKALSELAQSEIRGKIGNDGLAVVASLRSYQDTLSGLDSVQLINRIDYSDTLAAGDGALAKAQQFKDEIVEVAQLVNDLQELNNRIDRRGRRLLDGPTSSMMADIAKSASTLSSAKIPLSSEARLQLSNTQVALNRLPDVVDNVMDREEKRILRGEMPSRKGVWKFSFDVDKMTDEERVKAFAQIENSQARYDLTVTCGRRGGELVIATFQPLGTDPKEIPWDFHGPKPERDIRLRIDSNAAFGARLEGRGYVNQGQVMQADNAQFKNLLHSSRLVFADIFPEEQVEVATAYPAQFSRLCELMASRRLISR